MSSQNIISETKLVPWYRRLARSPFFWTVTGITMEAVVLSLFAMRKIDMRQLQALTLGTCLMLAPAATNREKAIVEFSFLNTILGYQFRKKPWHNEIIPGTLTLSAMPFVNYDHVEEFQKKNIGLMLIMLEPHEWN